MGKEDICLRNYLSDPRRYADLWNGGLFEGQQLVRAEELAPIDTIQTKADREHMVERMRDAVMKQTKDGSRYVLWALENQKTVDYSMPARIMLQEALEYNGQIREMKRKNRLKYCAKNENKSEEADRLTAGEYLYGVRKSDRLHPVVTLVVYWGEEDDTQLSLALFKFGRI